MYHKYHTKGIVLTSYTYRSQDKIISIFTQDFGILKVKAQGVRNINSKLRFASQDFTVGSFSLVQGRAGWRLVSARSEKNLFEIFKDSDLKLKTVANILSLIRKLSGEEEKQEFLFEVLNDFFNFLIDCDEKEVVLVECLVLLRVLHILGYLREDPDLLVKNSTNFMVNENLVFVAAQKTKIISLINESLKAASLT